MSTVLRGAARLLADSHVPNPDPDSTALLAHAWGIDASDLARRRLFGDTVPTQVTENFAQLIERRRQRVPLQHLVGSAAFRHLELQVGPGVFVPRPETELLVTEILEELERQQNTQVPFVIDLCSGSGAITLSLATEHPQLAVIGVERETEALNWSLKNLASVHLGDSTVDLVSGDATSFADERPELWGRADVVVTNPPYVPDEAVPRDPEVREHDPAAALYGGSTGLEIPALIMLQAEKLLRPGGFFIMEHSEEQGRAACELIMSTASLRQAVTFPDYTGRDRYTVAHRVSEVDL
ncbi:MAG: peptide chain release factor N(5)-glutamine methyltransferase [Brevibacterium sp.]|uniref:peptide chain release factor N(5)-glutamine methyltransferase n=1 Tax=Brevibacterium sp. TaxID=1701 RepID=UPI002649F4C2|nr:peptide chain release factor N(5)-glutamine methyltransferase [Brevibacterium sp.]MDN5805690.1 peptide chain release factor N(5)-glutamine methyltransferase [Brevibacterium sp.]MDN5834218.1 peptide chain release factor N(5)-glutamine methyltransferase [Brevibacterium sp.]MDN5875871.1 peptide chain release factor N(5)-glutamine methyltransferase [Brevibacterium sp.]MDN5908763.1 peptide chain release factor N(5)-glutamine methyltransferase [Brevibacterium sp.]MDN6134978.1 peptide chain releas